MSQTQASTLRNTHLAKEAQLLGESRSKIMEAEARLKSLHDQLEAEQYRNSQLQKVGCVACWLRCAACEVVEMYST